MSSIETWFFDNLSLKHISTVKTVQVLWRQSNIGDVKQFHENMFQEPDETPYPVSSLQRTITQKFDNFVDSLILPQPIKNDLSLFFWQMSKAMMDWLILTLKDMPLAEDPNVAEKMLYFVDNMIWDSVGCIDGKAMMESYVSNKETIDFATWAQLCNYCSEGYIRQFFDTVNWQESYFDSRITTFWYYTIHGTFPTLNMFRSFDHYLMFRTQHAIGIYENDNINRTAFIDSVSCGNLSAVKFFWKRLREDEKLEFSSNEELFDMKCNGIVVYLLGQIKFEYSSSHPMDCGAWGYLWGWPWVLFIDSWIDKYKDMDGMKFIGLFNDFLGQRDAEKREDGIGLFSRNLMRGHLHAKYYIPFEKLWRLSLEKFGLMGDHVPALAGMVFNSGDIILCKILTKGSTRSCRKLFLSSIYCYCTSVRRLPGQYFRKVFKREILVTKKERRSFQQMVWYVSALRSIMTPRKKLRFRRRN